MPAPSISVIVATIEPWPVVQACLDQLMPQVNAVGGELLLADGTTDGRGRPPEGVERYPRLRTLTLPGGSVFSLRALAAKAATAEYLAFTEDHCHVSDTWVSQLLAAHRDHPDADMVAGAVTNGSSDGLVDWANFLMTFAEFMPPAPDRPLRRTPPMANASFRSRVMLGGALPEGWLELVLAPTLVHERRFHHDDRILVSHVQPRSVRSAWAAHYNNGRASAGLVLPHIAPRDWWIRVLTTPVMPWILFVSVLRSLRGRRIPARARLSTPVVFLLGLAHATGEFTGLFFGEGASARQLN